ncbi:MAG: chromosome segregation protein SMC [Chlorobi bacterium]|nr:chromosome segregation protein SMC [Chlorobiota bacterium]
MYLSRIELHGFKSFADRTILRFGEGLTAIVGPNGSGKTNIIDAIRWVLGEQKTSLLRADGMSDVIFSGTRTRKPLGMAEVSIIIENTKRILPAEFSEVVVTRRLFRDGESQYFLNGSPCRRKDIVELFTDTGMGADAYSVIELKMVEQILEDHSDERRHLFEEAAGIVKYKQRRKETLAKLDATRNDLERVVDHLTEVRRTVNSLKRQAERAERYNELSSQLRSLQLERTVRTFAEHIRALSQLDEQIVSITGERDNARANLELIVRQSTLLDQERASLEIQREEVLSEHGRVSTQLAEIERSSAVLRERISAAEATLSSVLDDVRSRAIRRDQLDDEIERHQNELETLQREHTETEQQRSQLVSEISVLHQELEDARFQLQSVTEPLRTLEREHERLNAYRSQLRRNVELLQQRATTFTERLSSLHRIYSESETQHHTLTKQYDRARAEQREKEHTLITARQQRESIEHTIEQLRQQREAFTEQLSHLRAEHALVSSIIVHAELDLSSAENFPVPDVATLGDTISIDQRWAVALESALRGGQHYLLVPTLDQAAAVAAWLHTHRRPKVHIICTELIPHIPEPEPLPNAFGAQWLSSLIECDEPVASLLRAMLDGVTVTESLDHADRLFASARNIRAVVTQDGQMRFREGIFRVGVLQRTEGLSIGRHERLATIEQRIEQIEAELSAVAEALVAAIAQRDSIDLKQLGDCARDAERTTLEIYRQLDQLHIHRQQLERTIAELEAELKNIAHEQTALAAEDAALDERLSANEIEQTELLGNREAFVEQVRRHEQRIVALDQQLRDAERNTIRQRARIEALRDTLSRLEAQRSALDSDEEGSHIEHEQLRSQLTAMEIKLTEYNTQQQIIAEQLEAIVTRRRSLEEAISEKRVLLQSHNEKAATFRSHMEQLHQRLHALSIERERLFTICDQLNEQGRSRFGVELSTCIPTNDPPTEQLDASIARIEAQIASLGAINFSALEQYQEERARLDELERQYRDLQASEANLRDTIAEINNTASQQFLQTFEAIRMHFKELFALLFHGDGDADLVMDGNDPLEARINIIARPKGKRPLTIEMLSGGEKTLTAIALLFAIYMVKPSPFCILDEVDAPLDDANIDRYLQLVRRFSETTQFLLITHNKRTMEAADILYGVTMQEPGISKIVSVRLTDPEIVSPSDQ